VGQPRPAAARLLQEGIWGGYERLSGDLPLPGAYVDSYEIDRPADLEVAEAHYGRALPARTPAIPMPRSDPTWSPVSPH
jgi:hypothetical protein